MQWYLKFVVNVLAAFKNLAVDGIFCLLLFWQFLWFWSHMLYAASGEKWTNLWGLTGTMLARSPRVSEGKRVWVWVNYL